MGLLFLTLGVILTIYGFTSDPVIYAQHSLGENVNIRWGIVFFIFGAIVFSLAKKKKA